MLLRNLFLAHNSLNALKQGFTTWGTHTPNGTHTSRVREKSEGVREIQQYLLNNIKKNSQGVGFLGVSVHKKVGNHCSKVFGTFWRTAIDEEEHSGTNFEIVDDKLRTS